MDSEQKNECVDVCIRITMDSEQKNECVDVSTMKQDEEKCETCGSISWENHWHEGRLCGKCHADLFIGSTRKKT